MGYRGGCGCWDVEGVKRGLISGFPTRYLTSKSPLEQPQALFCGIFGDFLVPTI